MSVQISSSQKNLKFRTPTKPGQPSNYFENSNEISDRQSDGNSLKKVVRFEGIDCNEESMLDVFNELSDTFKFKNSYIMNRLEMITGILSSHRDTVGIPQLSYSAEKFLRSELKSRTGSVRETESCNVSDSLRKFKSHIAVSSLFHDLIISDELIGYL